MKRIIFCGIILFSLIFTAAAAEADLKASDFHNAFRLNSVPDTEAPVRNDLFRDLTEKFENTPEKRKITVMVYLCGSNLEGRDASATLDLIEMKESGFNEEDVNVVIFAGGSWIWQNDDIPDWTSGIYRISEGQLSELFNDGTSYNMGAADTLCSFLTAAYMLFPADHYALILWDHGGGSIGGVCQDQNFPGDFLDMDELAESLKASPFGNGRKLDWIGFDACLMAAAETAKVVAPYAEYMIASEEYEPSSSWNYSFLNGIENDASTAATGVRIIDSYVDFCTKKYDYKPVSDFTLACIDLAAIGSLEENINSFFSGIDVDTGNFAAFSKARRETISFGLRNEYDLVDLGDMIRKFAPFSSSVASQQVMEALAASVVYSAPETDGGTGLTVYFPFENKMELKNNLETHGKYRFSDSYERFIADFSGMLLSDSTEIWGELETSPKMEKDMRTRFMVTLNEEQLAYIADASIIALMKAEDGEGWIFVAEQEAQISEDGILAGDYVHTNLFITDENGEPYYDVPLEYIEQKKGSFTIRIILEDDQQQKFNARLICSKDPGADELTVRDVYLEDEAIGGYSPRLTADLNDYQRIYFPVAEREKTYRGKTLLWFTEWNIVDTKYYSMDLDKPLRLAFVKDVLDTSSLAAAFRIVDIFNNVFMSEPIAFSRKSGPVWRIEYDDDFVLFDHVKLSAAPDGSKAIFSVYLKNKTDAEYYAVADNLITDGKEQPGSAAVYGTGPNYGLLPDESQMLSFSIPLDAGKQPGHIQFMLTFYDAEDEMIGVTAVNVYP